MGKINIQVLGSGCPTCKTLYSKVIEVARKIDSALEVEYITDVSKIIELGAMSSPVFAIDGDIITAGKLPNDQEIKDSILAKIKE